MLMFNYITPAMFKDSDGYFWDYVLDAVFIAIGIKDFIDDPSWSKGFWLGLDIILAIVPFVLCISSARHLNKLDDAYDLMKTYGHIDDFADAGGFIRMGNQADFTADAWEIINSLDSVNDFTKSTLGAGREIHRGFMDGGEMINFANRADGIDNTAKIIFELKPYNPRSIRQGIKQLYRYQNATYDISGELYRMVLILY